MEDIINNCGKNIQNGLDEIIEYYKIEKNNKKKINKKLEEKNKNLEDENILLKISISNLESEIEILKEKNKQQTSSTIWERMQKELKERDYLIESLKKENEFLKREKNLKIEQNYKEDDIDKEIELKKKELKDEDEEINLKKIKKSKKTKKIFEPNFDNKLEDELNNNNIDDFEKLLLS